MVGEEIHHQWIAIVVIVVVAVAVVFRGILIIVVCVAFDFSHKMCMQCGIELIFLQFWSLDYLLLLHGKT